MLLNIRYTTGRLLLKKKLVLPGT